MVTACDWPWPTPSKSMGIGGATTKDVRARIADLHHAHDQAHDHELDHVG